MLKNHLFLKPDLQQNLLKTRAYEVIATKVFEV